MLIILGPTATGKTRLAAAVAALTQGEIISADSRQVFRGMDIGSGKDLSDYVVSVKKVPYHLIDIAAPGEEYSVFRFQNDFLKAWKDITNRNSLPILCGGTGLYLESIINGYRLIEVPANHELRISLQNLSMEELTAKLTLYRRPHSTTDTIDRDRILRAIEIEKYHYDHPEIAAEMPAINKLIIGVKLEREEIRQRITKRLKERLDQGMIAEVSNLINSGVSPESLLKYGLEYKYITQHLLGQLSFDQLFTLLNTAIHQFAKRQTTWFRRMERNGCPIHWIDGMLAESKKVEMTLDLMKQANITY